MFAGFYGPLPHILQDSPYFYHSYVRFRTPPRPQNRPPRANLGHHPRVFVCSRPDPARAVSNASPPAAHPSPAPQDRPPRLNRAPLLTPGAPRAPVATSRAPRRRLWAPLAAPFAHHVQLFDAGRPLFRAPLPPTGAGPSVKKGGDGHASTAPHELGAAQEPLEVKRGTLRRAPDPARHSLRKGFRPSPAPAGPTMRTSPTARPHTPPAGRPLFTLQRRLCAEHAAGSQPGLRTESRRAHVG